MIFHFFVNSSYEFQILFRESFTLNLYFNPISLFTIVTRNVDCWRIKLGHGVVSLYIPGPV